MRHPPSPAFCHRGRPEGALARGGGLVYKLGMKIAKPIGLLPLLVLALLAPLRPGSCREPGVPDRGVPCRALFAGPRGGLVEVVLTGWNAEGPRLAPLEEGRVLPEGRPFWLAPLAVAESEARPVRVLLFPRGRLHGARAVTDEEGEVLRLEGTPLGDLEVPVPRLRGLLYGPRIRGWSEEELLAKAGPGEELLLRVAKRGFDPIKGFFYRLSGKAFHFAPAGREQANAFPVEGVAALLRGADPLAREKGEKERPPHRLSLNDGTTLPVGVVGLAEGMLRVKLPWGGVGRTPVKRISGLELPGPDFRFLSMLRPSRVEERSWFGPNQPFLYPHQRDRSCTGGPLLAGGVLWSRGLGCHSRCRLTYTLDKKWKRFFALAALDDTAARLDLPGRADLRVLVDGRKAWEARDLGPGVPPRTVGPLSLEGVKELTLEVDFGARLHVGDRVGWLLPVLYR